MLTKKLNLRRISLILISKIPISAAILFASDIYLRHVHESNVRAIVSKKYDSNVLVINQRFGRADFSSTAIFKAFSAIFKFIEFGKKIGNKQLSLLNRPGMMTDFFAKVPLRPMKATFSASMRKASPLFDF
jgi:hypothetical protein